MAKLYVGMTGVKLRVNTGIDLSSASKVLLKVRKPSGAEVEWQGIANGTYIEYIVQDGDLDEPGCYKIQAYVEFDPNVKLYGDTEDICIYRIFS